MKVFLGTDHAGFSLKEAIKVQLIAKGYEVFDEGALTLNPTDDYPAFIAKAARQVATHQGSFGIVFGKSGAGECIVANKIKGVRAFLGITTENVTLARMHNDANVLSLGDAFVTPSEAWELVHLFLRTQFSKEERHARRIQQIKDIEDHA